MIHSRLALRPLFLAAALAVAMAGCGSEITPPDRDDPFLYLVLNQVVRGTGTPTQTAFLLRTGSPTESEYLRADSFRMVRESDGAVFDWDRRGLVGPVVGPAPVGYSEADLIDGNYVMADSATGDGLGYQELEGGRAYVLRVEIDGSVIRGRTVVPGSFEVRLQTDRQRRKASWPRVPGAAGYGIRTSLGGRLELQTDTSHILDPEMGRGDWLAVYALDSNLFSYLADDQRGRAGIDQGFGVFGALQLSLLEL